MIIDRFRYDPRPAYHMQVVANRYTRESKPEEGLTLVFLHATGLHKETWEPVIEHMFGSDAVRNGSLKIKEAWAIEIPHHGESALLNETVIKEKFLDYWDGFEYPHAIHSFLTSFPGGVDLTKENLIGIGHSVGGNSLVLLQSLQPRIPFRATHLLDATVGEEGQAKDRMNKILTALTWTKADVWRSRKAALQDLSSKPGFRSWNNRTLTLFVEKALRTHPASTYAEPFSFPGVTLACEKSSEAACYRADDHHPIAMKILIELYQEGMPLHFIHSGNDEFGAKSLLEAQIDTSKGRIPTSMHVIHAGHMFVQIEPTKTADALVAALQISPGVKRSIL